MEDPRLAKCGEVFPSPVVVTLPALGPDTTFISVCRWGQQDRLVYQLPNIYWGLALAPRDGVCAAQRVKEKNRNLRVTAAQGNVPTNLTNTRLYRSESVLHAKLYTHTGLRPNGFHTSLITDRVAINTSGVEGKKHEERSCSFWEFS